MVYEVSSRAEEGNLGDFFVESQKNSSHQSCDENIKIDVSARKISAICCLIKSKSVDF